MAIVILKRDLNKKKVSFSTCVYDFENAVPVESGAGDYLVRATSTNVNPADADDPIKGICVNITYEGLDKLRGYAADDESPENLISRAYVLKTEQGGCHYMGIEDNDTSNWGKIPIGALTPDDWNLRWRDKYFTLTVQHTPDITFYNPVHASETFDNTQNYYYPKIEAVAPSVQYWSAAGLYFGLNHSFGSYYNGIDYVVQFKTHPYRESNSSNDPFWFKLPGVDGASIGNTNMQIDIGYFGNSSDPNSDYYDINAPFGGLGENTYSNNLYQMISFTYDDDDYIGIIAIVRSSDNIIQGASIIAFTTNAWKGESGEGYEGPISEPGGGDGVYEDESDVIRKRNVNGNITGALTLGYNFYTLTQAELGEFFSAAFLSSAYGHSFSDKLAAITQGTIDCYMLPWGPGFTGLSEQIHLCGEIIQDTSAKRLTNSQVWIDFGVLTIPRYYDTFLDYGPYTSMSIFLPFVGTFELPVNEFIGGAIQCYYILDLITGDCTAFVECWNQFGDNHLVGQFHGNCKYEIPIVAGQRNNSGLIAATGAAAAITFGAIKGAAAGSAAGPGGAVGGAILGAATGALATAPALINAAQEPPVNAQVIGKMGGSQGWTAYESPYIIMTRQIYNQPETFGTDKGYTSNVSAKIKDLTGFNMVSNFNLDGITNATEEERNEIANLLHSGFYV